MATRRNLTKENPPITKIYTNIVVSLLALEYLIAIGIKRIITKEKARYSLEQFLEGETSVLNLIISEED